MGRSAPQVCSCLLILYFCAFQVNQIEASDIPLAPNYDRARLSSIIAYKQQENQSESSESEVSPWNPYRIVITSLIVSGLLLALGLFLKGLIRRMHQKRMQEELSMTYHDAKLSSQFLSDLSGSEGSDAKTPNLPAETVTDKPVVIDIPTARSPIPSNISLTSPKGVAKKTVWQAHDFARVDLSDDRTTRISVLRRTSSLPSLSSDQSSSGSESRDVSRRDAVLLFGHEEDFLADLKKSHKREKKT